MGITDGVDAPSGGAAGVGVPIEALGLELLLQVRRAAAITKFA